jgi:hypothetical protein
MNDQSAGQSAMYSGAPAISAVDRLLTVYRAPGPYTSVYLTQTGIGPTASSSDDYWQQLRSDLAEQGATEDALDAIEARLGLPRPGDTAGVCVIAAADGTTAVAAAFEPPHHDFGVVDTLPYAAPMLEWDQRSVPHVVATVDRSTDSTAKEAPGAGRPLLGGDVVAFGSDRYTSLETARGAPAELADLIRDQVLAVKAKLVVIEGTPDATQPLVHSLAAALPIDTRVIEVESTGADDLAEQTVRYAADTAARVTVQRLRTHRFLRTHDAAVDGTDDTIAALANGTAEWILVHDDPNDQRRIWIGSEPNELSLEQRSGYEQARLVDAVIRSAVLQGAGVHIVPSTGAGGLDDDIAAILEADPSSSDEVIT